MIWLYWNRWRPAVLAIGACVTCLAVLVIVAGSLAPDDPGSPGPGASSASRPGTMARSANHLAGAASAVTAAQIRQGVSLMNAAVAACQADSYTGTQVVVWWGSTGSTTSLVKVWHKQRDRDLEITGGFPEEVPPPSLAQGTQSAASHAEGALTLSAAMLDLMQSNYQISYSGTGSAEGRPAQIVVVRDRDGVLAAQFWLDTATGLPLRREIFDGSGHLVNEGAFIDLQIGDNEVGQVPAVAGRSWSSKPAEQAVASLRAKGWQLPLKLAGDLALVEVTETSAKAGQVVDASYSDGLSVVSVFAQRGELTATMTGWTKEAIQGQIVLSGQPDNRTLAWSADGFVYTVIADASAQTVARVVADLPHDKSPGFWQRVGRGLKRIGSWINPFG